VSDRPGEQLERPRPTTLLNVQPERGVPVGFDCDQAQILQVVFRFSRGTSPDVTDELPTITNLAELVGLSGDDVFVRWSKGPAEDAASASCDSLTGVELPDLSAGPRRGGGPGPDNEPLVRCLEPLAWVAETALTECSELVDAQHSEEWGPLDRSSSDR
jgi:hypothetical protein